MVSKQKAWPFQGVTLFSWVSPVYSGHGQVAEFMFAFLFFFSFSLVQLLSRVRLFVIPVDGSTPGLPVHHQLPELAQIHVH